MGINPNNNTKVKYSVPDSILVVPFVIPTESESLDQINLYKGLRYYQQNRLNFPEVSFHYIVTTDGRVIMNPFSQTDRQVEIEFDETENPIVIGYFTSANAVGFSPSARGKVEALILNILNSQTIPLENIFIRGLNYSQNEEMSIIAKVEPVFLGWESEINKIIENITPSYVPKQRVYKITVEDLMLPSAEVPLNSVFEVKLKVRNDSVFGIYGGSTNELVLSLNEKKALSSFFFPQEWATPTQVKLMTEEQILLPGKEGEFVVQFKTPVAVGSIGEIFDILNVQGELVGNEPLDIAIRLAKSDKSILEIGDTGAGYLKVRKAPDIGSDEVSRVSTGTRYLVLDTSGGWYKIEYEPGQTGWVIGQYIKIIFRP